MMHMTFYWGKQVTVLFDIWKTQTWIEYFLTLIALLLFSILYQYLENLRLQFNPVASSPESTTEAPLLGNFTAKLPGAGVRAASSVLFGVNSALGYLLMLAVMSFNGGVLIAVVIGLALGYFFFRSSSTVAVAVDSACACA